MLFRFEVRVDAVNEFVVVVSSESAEKAIPNGENIAKVGISIGLYIMVMHVVHIGRDDKPTQNTV